MKKLYVVRKYIMARSIQDAVRNEKKVSPDDVWLDDDWKKANTPEPSSSVGFKKKKK